MGVFVVIIPVISREQGRGIAEWKLEQLVSFLQDRFIAYSKGRTFEGIICR